MMKVRAKRMIRPFLEPVFPAYMISPLGLRAKKVPGKFRVIQDLMAPFKGVSVKRERSHTTHQHINTAHLESQGHTG